LSWWGKVIGGGLGFMLGGPLGAVFGAAFGHNFDKGLSSLGSQTSFSGDVERVQTAFFTATFSIMGHIAKADGEVSQGEIRLAEDVMRQMNLNAQQKNTAQRLFNEGKKADFPINDVLQQFRVECHRRSNLMQMFMEIQVAIALSDGTLDSSESRILESAAGILGFSKAEYSAILNRMRAQRHVHTGDKAGMSLADAYKLLAINNKVSDQDVKKAYRRQMNQHHPDKLVSKGLPEEMMELANRKAQDIKSAYEVIKESRKK
tara:strand:- start:133 stop:915 length:783 start_codon:yes stop_codon:yes gene_type:complete